MATEKTKPNTKEDLNKELAEVESGISVAKTKRDEAKTAFLKNAILQGFTEENLQGYGFTKEEIEAAVNPEKLKPSQDKTGALDKTIEKELGTTYSSILNEIRSEEEELKALEERLLKHQTTINKKVNSIV